MSLTLTRRTLRIGLAPIVLLLSMSCRVVAEGNTINGKANQEVTVEEVIQRLEQVEAKLHSFRVHCLSNSQRQSLDIRVNGDGPERVFSVLVSSRATTNSVWHYRDDGSSRFEADRVQVDVTANGGRQVKRFSAYFVFDGPRGRGKHLWLNSPDSDVRMWGTNEEKYSSTPQGSLEMCPIGFLTRSSGRSYSQELRHEEAKITRREMLEGRSLVVLTTNVRQTRPNIEFYQHRELWVDVERGVVVRCETFERNAEEWAWGIRHRLESGDYQWEAGSQLWLPTSAKEFNWSVHSQGQWKLDSVEVFAYNHWEINPQIDDETFSIDQDWSSLKDRR